MIDFFIRSNWGRVVREDWRFRARFSFSGEKLQKDRPSRKKTTKHEKSKKKSKISVKNSHEKTFKSPTKFRRVRRIVLLLLKNNGRELCKDGSAFRGRRKRWRWVVAPSTGGESRNDGTYKKRRESERELDFFDHRISCSEIIIHSLSCFLRRFSVPLLFALYSEGGV